MGTVLISYWKRNYSIYLDFPDVLLGYPSNICPLCLLLVLHMLVPSIDSFLYHKTTLLKSYVFFHSRDYSSQSFGPTRMGLGSFWRGMKWVSKNVSTDLFSHKFFFNKFIKLLFFSKKFMRCSKIILHLFLKINEQKDIFVHSQSC